MAVYPGLSALTVGVDDLRASTRFYERLGWARSRAASGAASSLFRLNTGVLALVDRRVLAETHGLSPSEPRPLLFLTQHHRSPAAVDAACRAMASAGGRLVRAPGPAETGAWRALVADRDGVVFDFVHDRAIEIDADGGLALPP